MRWNTPATRDDDPPSGAGPDDDRSVDGLLPLALSRPQEALARARRVLAGRPGPHDASIARQAVGIVLRETGDVTAAVAELRAAHRLARRCEDPGREADVLATLGVALVFAGRTAAGLGTLDDAVERSAGVLTGRILLRRGGVLILLGRHREALSDLNRAVTVLGLAEDPVWLARALTERAAGSLALGRVRPAEDDLVRAELLFTRSGQELESADAVAHRGRIALRAGDLPAALTAFDEAAERYAALGTSDPALAVDRCMALLAAGLPHEALTQADHEIEHQDRIGGPATRRAELLLAAAVGALAAGEAAVALERADQAVRLFGRQGRGWWEAHARLARVRAVVAAGGAGPVQLREARRCVRELAALGSAQLPLAELEAGRIALGLGRTDVARVHLEAAARARQQGPALARAAGWTAEALRAEAAGDARQLIRACRRGLDVVDEHRAVLGSSELRAQATAHGAELATLGLRHALRLGRPRLLLAWSERWRAGALAVPPVRPPDDEELQADLAALRETAGRVWRAEGGARSELYREQGRLERAVRARALHARGGGAGIGTGVADEAGVEELLAELGDRRLVELVEVDGRLHALVCGGGRVRRFEAGLPARAAWDLDFARSALTRLAYGLSATGPGDVLERLRRTGTALQEVLLGDAARHLGDGEVVVVPPGRLHAVPWAALPALHDRVLAVAPSAATWLRARRAEAEAATGGGEHGDRVVLVHGPGLATGAAEVPLVADRYAAATGRRPLVLGDGTATVARVLDAIDGADLAHLAAHGTFRADSPLFSALRMDDGPLTVYDLERLRRAPRRIVLSGCDSGLAAPAGADELLGLVSALIPLGTRGVVASVVPVNDEAVVGLMIALHARLRTGASLARALRDARLEADDPLAVATGWSFVALGAG